MRKNNMLNDKIIFWWDGSSFIPTGGKLVKSTDEQKIFGFGAREIAAWLGNDIQYSINSVNIWINNLTDLEHSRAPDGMFGIGNAHWVLITGNYVFIGTEYVEEQQVIMTKEQLLYVLEQYKAFLGGDYKDPDNPPAPIDVEFIAEGQEAIDIYNGLPNSHLVPYAC
ncbi:hypothetical protein FcAc13_11915 [Frischella sp. Ac13]|uniref:Uncharacterized protein n=2 Tax=Frischella japonica TaxID=2741544 RepID=A0ABR7R0L3_9GAMM|nr:hypothetical protein [Frischella japonica]